MTEEAKLPEAKLPEAELPALAGPKMDMATGMTTAGGLVPKDLGQLWQLSTIMSRSGMMPKGIQSPQAVCVAVQMGLEVGLSPMQAVQNIAVINGRPSLWGDSVLGLVRASGLLEDFDEYLELNGVRLEPKDSIVNRETPDKTTAICRAKRKGEGEIVRIFSVADAKAAKLWFCDPASPWTKYPKRMLQMRARSWCLRDGFGDIIKGLHVAEEVIDMVPTAKEEAADLTEQIKTGKTENPVTYEVEPPEPSTTVDPGPGQNGEGEEPVNSEGNSLVTFIKKARPNTSESNRKAFMEFIADNLKEIYALPNEQLAYIKTKYQTTIKADLPELPPESNENETSGSEPVLDLAEQVEIQMQTILAEFTLTENGWLSQPDFRKIMMEYSKTMPFDEYNLLMGSYSDSTDVPPDKRAMMLERFIKAGLEKNANRETR